MSKTMAAVWQMTEVWVGVLGLAAFLTLFWVLRGAPIGQAVAAEEDEDAPRGNYRDRVVTAATFGLLLILAGGYLAVTRGVAWSLPAFGLGFATVFALVLINGRYRHGSPTLRRTLDLSTAALNAALFLGVLVVANVLAFRYGGRAIDMTRGRGFTLSSLTVGQIRSLSRPATFTTFFGRSGVAAQQRERVDQLLELYRAANPEKVRLDHVDPYRDPQRYEDLVKLTPDIDVTQGGGVVVGLGEGPSADRVVVRNADLFSLPKAARYDPEAERFESVFKGEDAITSALIRLREGKRPRVVFTTGHGEPSVDDNGVGKPALGFWKSRLTATGNDVVAVNLLTQELPEDAALVVVVGPTGPFKPEEVSRLRAYSDGKKPLLVLAGDPGTTGLDEFLKGFDVEVGPGVVVEPRANYRGRIDTILVEVVNSTQPLTEPLNNQIFLLSHALPLRGAPPTAATGVAPRGLFLSTPLLRTTAQSWAETDLANRRPQRDKEDPSGPLTVAVAVNDRPPQGATQPGPPRLVVVGSRYAADNVSIQLNPANLDLMMNAVNWLRGRADLGGIAPQTHVALSLTADPVVKARLVLVPTVMAMLLIATLGAATYLARRS